MTEEALEVETEVDLEVEAIVEVVEDAAHREEAVVVVGHRGEVEVVERRAEQRPSS